MCFIDQCNTVLDFQVCLHIFYATVPPNFFTKIYMFDIILFVIGEHFVEVQSHDV